MQYNDEEEESVGGGWYLLKNVGLMLTGGAIAAVLVGVFTSGRVGDRFLSALGHFLNPPAPAPKVDVQSLMIEKIRDASELTTAVYTMQAVVPTSQDSNLGGFVIGTTRLLYIAHGQVQAGVDLSKLAPASVQSTADSVQVQLPPPQILNSKIDVNRSQVYDYNRGMLGLGPDVAPQLQTLAQQEALKKVVAAACEDGVLNRANDRAKLVVTQLLAAAGYKTVTVQVQPPAANACALEEKPAEKPAEPVNN
jgi:hypothetical protein